MKVFAMPDVQNKYAGRLEYLDEPGHLQVDELFIRESHISLSGASVTPEYGSWAFTAELPLVQGMYQRASLRASKDGVASDPFELRMRVTQGESGCLLVDGIWVERFSSRFKGVLHVG
ncbi:hypothetical protein PG2T_02345 [Immundisolibacter cernigliae]|uniref:Uncharacterized protein n=2 Tax=Immundisolibacter cernigliae TaxID=1810504 RepID=A0A1B1YQV8_9GAMM|nr:hypothetical protein PG2T_02345 [Immundisolibacter cernigliae]